MRYAAIVLGLFALQACDQLTGSFSDVIAVRVSGASSRRVEEGTTLQLAAVALDLAGDTIAADIRWAIVDTATGILVDSTTGLVTAVAPGGPWRVQARVESLRADPVLITVAGAPDSVAVAGDSVVVTLGSSPSPAMTVRVFDLTTVPGTALGAAGVRVRFAVVAPTASGLVLRASTSADSLATADTTSATASGTGAASAVLRATGSLPDSVVVDAVVTTAGGVAVAGSPVRFVVRYQ